MFLTVEVGEHKCSSKEVSPVGSNNEILCALKCNMCSQEPVQVLPPVGIIVNYGDGTGEQWWTREDPRDLWTHRYQMPGRYTVSVGTINEYDKTIDATWLEVEVVDALYDDMGIEVVCPPVITPGEYFVCTADIPRGTDLLFSLDMEDDLGPISIPPFNMSTKSGWMSVPDPFLYIPGGSLKTRSWNQTKPYLLDSPTDPPGIHDNYILRSTQFEYQANITGIFYVPATTGTLLIDILRPKCPFRVDPYTKAVVETFWCPITSACESNCYSELQMKPDWSFEWGPEFVCKGTLDFCSLEGMCNYQPNSDTCALSPSGEFGGISVEPHAPKNITDQSEEAQLLPEPSTSEALWNYNISHTFEITVSSSDLWLPQFLDIWKEYYYDPEREQTRKAHVEE